jgi:glycosyltransferase involved in cell wall biosynthesis
VIVSDIPALVESTGGAAKVVGARDPDELAQAMAEVLNDDEKRAELIEAGRRRSAELSWTQTAIKTMEIYRSLV